MSTQPRMKTQETGSARSDNCATFPGELDDLAARLPISITSGERLLGTKQAAIRTGYSPKTLANWRVLGIGPGWIQRCARGRVLYPEFELDRWLAANHRHSTSKAWSKQ